MDRDGMGHMMESATLLSREWSEEEVSEKKGDM
jgi:hypothetical protein